MQTAVVAQRVQLAAWTTPMPKRPQVPGPRQYVQALMRRRTRMDAARLWGWLRGQLRGWLRAWLRRWTRVHRAMAF